MTDKEIIIDSIDIRKCKHFEALYESRPNGFGGITIENYCYLYKDNCEKYPQCLYRSNRLQQLETQLQREKQNSQEAIDTSIREFNRAEELKTLLKRKEQECEELRTDIKDIANLLDLDTFEEYNFGNIEMEIKELKQQLDQLKAENEELKKIIERLDVPKHEVIDMHIAMENEKLKVENEELKKQLQAQRAFTRHEQKLIYCAAYDETCKTGNDCKQEKCIFKDNIKLKQTLTEIKEISENMNEECFYDDFDCMNCDMQNGCTYINKKQILQKISEVLKDE